MFSLFKKKKQDDNSDDPQQQKLKFQLTFQPIKIGSHTLQLTHQQKFQYEYLLQYLQSPLWKIPIQEFLDYNCIVFEDDELNHFEYSNIHNKFMALVDDLLQLAISEMKCSEENLVKIVEYGCYEPTYAKYFQQITLSDNFFIFKKLMVKRNKDLQLETIKALQEEQQKLKQQQQIPIDQNELLRAQLEKEKAEIDQAIAMSIAIENERQSLLQTEEQQIEQAILESQRMYDELIKKSEQLKISENSQNTFQKGNIEMIAFEGKLNDLEDEDVPEENLLQTNQQLGVKVLPSPQKLSSQNLEQSNKNLQNKVPEIKNSNLSSLSNIPALPAVKPKSGVNMDGLLMERQKLLQQLNELKQTETQKQYKEEIQKIENFKVETEKQQQEELYQRKKMLLAQRDMILQKKKEAQDLEMKKFKNQEVIQDKQPLKTQQSLAASLQSVLNDEPEEIIDQKKIEKQKQLFSKIKTDLKINDEFD